MIEFRNGIVGNHTDVKDETDVILKECLDSHISIPLGAYVGLLQNKIIVCGGYDYTDILQTCNIIGQPNKLITMHSKRFYAAAVSLYIIVMLVYILTTLYASLKSGFSLQGRRKL